jgi:hypothetical protein
LTPTPLWAYTYHIKVNIINHRTQHPANNKKQYANLNVTRRRIHRRIQRLKSFWLFCCVSDFELVHTLQIINNKMDSEQIKARNAIQALQIATKEIDPADYEIINRIYNIIAELHNKYLA